MKKHKATQLVLFRNELFKNEKRFFGGALLKGRRKSKRPLSTKDPIHIVMRSLLAQGQWSFLQKGNRLHLEGILKKHSKKWGVRIYRQAIVSNHIHLCVRITNRYTWAPFIRSVTGEIAYFVSQRKRGYGSRASQKALRFWEFRPFSRVLHWGRDFKRVCGYVEQNTLEAIGFIPYSPRLNWYAKLSSA